MSTQKELEQLVVFEQLTTILDELHEKISQNLTMFPKEHQPFRNFASLDGKINGSLLTFSGEVVDKLIHSKINAMQMGFGTMRLVTWLNSSIQVPHLAFELGTTPNLFFYMDYVPRVDLWSDVSYLQHYYQSVASTHSELRENPHLSVFVSKSLYMRQLMSPAHICFTGSNTEDSLGLVQRLSHEMCDRWLTWVAQAPPVPEENQNVLAERDVTMRQISAESDPGNRAIAKIFGEDFTNQLVEALWRKESTSSDVS